MSMFILTISCLTTSSLPWFMDLTSQVPIHYCSLQHQILLLSLDTSTTEHRFCFGLPPSFFLGLLVTVLNSFSIANWTPSNLQDSSFGIIFFFMSFYTVQASLMAQLVKNPPAMWEIWVWSLGWEDPLEKGMATHSSILSWRIPWTGEPSRLQSIGSQRVGHNWETLTFTFLSLK